MLENIEEKDEINYDNIQRCTICENELTKEELGFNKQISSFKQGRVQDENYEVKENQEKIDELGKAITENNLQKSSNESKSDPFL